jgi:aminocarboxymuconate-semialdehyde decarboxylase
MDRHPDVLQVLTVPGATVDELAEPGKAVDLARSVNDELAELVFKYPDRFVAGVAVLPMSDIDAALDEIDRAVNDLKLRGILLRVPVNGKPMDRPEFFPIYEKMCQHNLPIWFHPHKSPKVPDYPDEDESKYIIWHLWGLVVETTVTMTRLVMSGVMEKFPELKIITHHCGAMVPFFWERIVNHYNQSEMRNHTDFKVGLRQAPVDYFRRFYVDTALIGNTPALMCSYDFYGAEQILFGSDAPFDGQAGFYGAPRTIKAIEAMDIPEGDRNKIFEENARKLLRLPA